MPQYAYMARDGMGKRVTGTQIAEGEDQLTRMLREMDLYLVSASPEEAGEKRRWRDITIGKGKIKRRDLIEFSYHMSTIISAGIPLLQGMQDLVDQRKRTPFGSVIQRMRTDVEGGATLFEALSRHSTVFGETYLFMVRAGEASGTVARIFQELGKFLEWQEEIASTVRRITIYPAVVLTSVLLLTLFVFAFAFPKVARILTEMKIPLPFSTQILITLSTFLTTYWYLALAGISGVILTLRWFLRNPVNSLAVDRLKLRIPLFGTLVRQIAVSRFAHHLALLLEAGIGIFDALVATERVVGNRVFSEAIRDLREQVEGGMTLTDALRRSGEFPPMTIRMVQVGESSATLVESLNRVADYYDKEVPNTVKKVFAAAEPMLIVLLAVVVAFVALSIYLPIYRSIGMIGK